MARIKIFYFIPNLQQGGPEGQILELINQLPPRFEPVLCVYHADDTTPTTSSGGRAARRDSRRTRSACVG
jgi:hypothetical protein